LRDGNFIYGDARRLTGFPDSAVSLVAGLNSKGLCWNFLIIEPPNDVLMGIGSVSKETLGVNSTVKQSFAAVSQRRQQCTVSFMQHAVDSTLRPGWRRSAVLFWMSVKEMGNRRPGETGRAVGRQETQH